ncbi:MAG TPA: galactokinase family protein [Rectinemataceae bacterium]
MTAPFPSPTLGRAPGEAYDIPSRLPVLGSPLQLYGSDATVELIGRFRTLSSRLAAFAEPLPSTRPGAAKAKGSEALPTEILFYSAPGRTELCGNHTDHNSGRVLAAAVSLDSAAALRFRPDPVCRVCSEGFGTFEIRLDDLDPKPEEKGSSASILRGIAAGISGRFHLPSLRPREPGGGALKGFDACVDSLVPPGSGLSSSASFEVLVAAMLSDAAGLELSPVDMARLGQFAENEYFGKPCGLMDQMASALGSAVSMDFASDPPRLERHGFDPASFGYGLFILNTGGSHADLTEEYASIPREMRKVAGALGRTVLAGASKEELVERAPLLRSRFGDRAFLRAWHFVNETERPALMARAIDARDMETLLGIVRASSDSSWKYLQNLGRGSCPDEQGLALALAITEDFLGSRGACRVHGGGFAGTIQAYVPLDLEASYRRLVESIFGPGSLMRADIRPWGVVRIESF